MAELLRSGQLRRARALPQAPPRWTLEELAGRLVEISGEGQGAALTVAAGLVLDAQRAQEPAAWILFQQASAFFPPDLAANGVDLAALAVIQVKAEHQALRAADRLLRCGAFGLVLLDLVWPRTAQLSLSAQTRLASLAQRHHSALVCLTSKPAEAGSLGSLVTLHARARRRAVDPGDNDGGGCFRCEVQVLKDKRRGPSWTHVEICCGPPGLY